MRHASRRRERHRVERPRRGGDRPGSPTDALPASLGPPREPRWASLPTDPSGLPPLPPSFRLTLERALGAIDLRLPPPPWAAIEAQARLLLAWSEVMNLTALRAPEEVALEHVADSLAALPLIARLARPGPKLVDVGSGGGYPGLPLAVTLPARTAILVDPVAKKAAFLGVAASAARRAFADVARPDAPLIEGLRGRAEDLAADGEQREDADLVVARAVARLPELAEICLPLVRRGGWFVAWKRLPGLDEELALALPAIRVLGGALGAVMVESVAVPGLEDHCLVAVRKDRETPPGYPRPAADRRRRLLR